VQANKEWIADPSNGKQLSNFYKCFVGKGNNSMLIRTLFKSRFWWLLYDKEEFDKVNFIWTQLRKKSVMEQFKCKLSLGNKSEFSQPMPNLKALNQSSEKFKKRKTSSANSRSPEHEIASEKLG
jgi:tubulin polyglutamylase TTLL1/tubulin monoglycylase TTLL3/8